LQIDFASTTAILELVVGPSLVIRAGLLEHLMEDGPLRGASRLLALDRGKEIVVEGLSLILSRFLLVVVLFGPPAGAFVVFCWCLPLAALVAKESTDDLLVGSVVRHYVHQLVDSLRMISP
jgi:hypothetical protein